MGYRHRNGLGSFPEMFCSLLPSGIESNVVALFCSLYDPAPALPGEGFFQ